MNSELRKNVESEIGMLREISNFSRRLENADIYEKKLLEDTVDSLKKGIKIINASTPEILRSISLAQKLPSKSKRPRAFGLEKIKTDIIGTEIEVVLTKQSKTDFLKVLNISEDYIRRIKRAARKHEEEKRIEFQASRGYLRLANKYFFNLASERVKQGMFKSLSASLRRANVNILFESYIAMLFFSVFLAFVIAMLVSIFIFFFDLNLSWPLIAVYSDGYLLSFAKIFWIPIVVPLLTFLAVYYYPSTEKKSIGYRVNQELPFAVIHMSAISGSGIAPAEIFKIVGLSEDYPFLKKEIRKILNQINLYGYDLVTALNNAAKAAPSEKLADLFSGFSVTITSGANLQDFLEKRAESLLLSYRLEREKYTKLIETFLDIYISVVIAAPMVFLLLFILMSISGIQVGFTSVQLSIISVIGIALLNILFLVFLQIKQPPY